MVTTANNEISSLLFDDQAGDPSTPASGFSRVYTKSDGLYVIDDAGNVTGPFAETTGGSGGIVDFAEVFYTSGDISVTTATVGTAIPSLGTLSLSGTAGDVVGIVLTSRITDSDAESMRIDVKLTGSASRFLSSRTSTADNLGVAGFFGFASTATSKIGGTVFIELVANDLSAGVCTITACAWLSSAGNRPIAAGTSGPLIFQAVNFGQP